MARTLLQAAMDSAPLSQRGACGDSMSHRVLRLLLVVIVAACGAGTEGPATIGDKTDPFSCLGDDPNTLSSIDDELKTFSSIGDEPNTFLRSNGIQNSNPLKVFILAGQSNMEGQGIVEPEQKHLLKNGGKGTLRYMVRDAADKSKYLHLVDSSGNWSSRSDVWLVELTESGPLTVKGRALIGPETQFGHIVGNYYEGSNVLLIKTAWGGKSLYSDFRPPSSSGGTGAYYTQMIKRVHEVLDNIKNFYPEYNGQGYDIVGFGWHQGWNDRINDAAVAEYQENSVNLINDLRDEFNVPEMPFVLATTGMGGWSEAGERALALMNAQLAVPNDSRLKVNKNVIAVDTRDFWIDEADSPSGLGYHWNNNAKTYFLIGNGMGTAMTGMLQSELYKALSAISSHIKGSIKLNDSTLKQHKDTIDSEIKLLGSKRELISAAFDAVENYENVHGPLFMNSDTKDGVPHDAGANIHTVIISIMQGIVDHVYTSRNLSEYKKLLNDFYFKSSKYFPGEVTSIPDPNVIHTVKINGSYPKTFGHLTISADVPARKPTGTYLVPGDVATVTVPQSMVGKGYQIRVGAHVYDLSNKPSFKRLDRTTILYAITSEKTEIASPLGGGIYIEVPYLQDAGIVTVTIQNAVRSPYFSMKSFHKTSSDEWKNTERTFGAPWADFQTEKFMMQVPTSWIYNYGDPTTVLKQWDEALDVVSDFMGFPHTRGREVLYLQADVYIRAKAYSPGYPQVNVTYNPNKAYDGNSDNPLLTGPFIDWRWMSTEFHELGHGHLFQKFPGETESAVNLLYPAVLNRKLGLDIQEAFYKSRRNGAAFNTLENAAVSWMITENFKNGNPMTTEEMKYQYRGHAKYVEVARLFGWTVLDRYWRSFNESYEKTVSPQNTDTRVKGDYDRSNNGLILSMSREAGVDLTPLIDFWGVHPNNRQALKGAIAAANLKPSAKIYQLLLDYKAKIPADKQEYRTFVMNWFEEQPEAGTYAAVLLDTWSTAYSGTINNNVQNIIDLYFPNGRP